MTPPRRSLLRPPPRGLPVPPRPVLSLALLAALLAGSAGCASDTDAEDLDVTTYLHNAQGYAEGGHYDQALSQFRQALAIDPGNDKALLGEATCLYWMGTEEAASAGGHILLAEEKFEKLDPSSYGENAWKVHLGRGMVHARLAELWGRKADLARRQGGDAAALLQIREAEGKVKLHDAKASSEFDAVLAMSDQPLARNNLTALFFLATHSALAAKDEAGLSRSMDYFHRYEKEVEKSKALWVEMEKREPKLADLYRQKLKAAERQEVELRDLMANILFKQRRHEDSIKELDKVLALDPWRASAFLNRARNEEELGRFGAAADDYRRFLKATDLPPGSAPVIEATDRMRRCEEAVRERMDR